MLVVLIFKLLKVSNESLYKQCKQNSAVLPLRLQPFADPIAHCASLSTVSTKNHSQNLLKKEKCQACVLYISGI